MLDTDLFTREIVARLRVAQAGTDVAAWHVYDAVDGVKEADDGLSACFSVEHASELVSGNFTMRLECLFSVDVPARHEGEEMRGDTAAAAELLGLLHGVLEDARMNPRGEEGFVVLGARFLPGTPSVDGAAFRIVAPVTVDVQF